MVLYFASLIIRQFLQPFDETTYTYVSNLETIIVAVLSGMMYIIVARKFSLETTSGKIWLSIGVGILVWSVGEIIYAIYDIVFSQEIFPSLADIPWVLGYVFLFVGILWEFKIVNIKVKPLELLAWIAVNAILFILGAVTLFVPVIQYAIEEFYPLIDTVLTLFYPVTDLLLVFASGLIFLKFRGGKIAWPWLIVAIGFIIIGVGDAWYNLLAWEETYENYSWADIPYYLGYLLLLVGAMEMHKLLSVCEPT